MPTEEEEEEAPDDGPTVRELQARLAAAYLVGGAADPIPFPADVHPDHSPAGVHAWAEALPERCPAASNAIIEVDCGEYPCIVGVAWDDAEAVASEVVCVKPTLADNTMMAFERPLGSRYIDARLMPVGPNDWPDAEKERLSRRWSMRRSALTEHLVEVFRADDDVTD